MSLRSTARSRLARLRPPSKRGSVTWGVNDQARWPERNRSDRSALDDPRKPVSEMRGKKAARAAPMSALRARSRCSAAWMSGRWMSSSDGVPADRSCSSMGRSDGCAGPADPADPADCADRYGPRSSTPVSSSRALPAWRRSRSLRSTSARAWAARPTASWWSRAVAVPALRRCAVKRSEASRLCSVLCASCRRRWAPSRDR